MYNMWTTIRNIVNKWRCKLTIISVCCNFNMWIYNLGNGCVHRMESDTVIPRTNLALSTTINLLIWTNWLLFTRINAYIGMNISRHSINITCNVLTPYVTMMFKKHLFESSHLRLHLEETCLNHQHVFFGLNNGILKLNKFTSRHVWN